MVLTAIRVSPDTNFAAVTNSPHIAVGDFVEGRTGWREFAAIDPLST
jgi:hypothetical protein